MRVLNVMKLRLAPLRRQIFAASAFLALMLAGNSEAATVYSCADSGERCVVRLEDGIVGDQVRILDEKEMSTLGMGSLLGVAQGSANGARIVVLEWWGDAKGQDVVPLAVIGKGVTFDTGGINLKGSSHIADMKYDMAGAGVVAGLMKTLAETKSPKNVVGFLGLVENMPSGTA